MLKQLACKTAARDGKAASSHMNNFLEGLSVAIRTQAARAVLKRISATVDTRAVTPDTAAA
eukprot:3957440-Karenia_brevis.AAC.1